MTSPWIVHWNVDPVALQVGPVAIHWYGLCWMLAFLLANVVVRRTLARLGREDIDVDALTMASLLGTVIGARLAHCLFYEPGFYLSHPLKVLAVWEGGMASHGGAVGFLLATAWAARRHAPGMSLLTLLDIASLPACIGGAIVRVANFLNSEILGTPPAGHWGVVFDRYDPTPRIPVQLLEAVAYGVMGVFLFWASRRNDTFKHHGRLTGWYLVLVFGARAVLETWKMPQAAYEAGHTLSVGQWLSVPFVLVGLGLLWRTRSESPLSVAGA